MKRIFGGLIKLNAEIVGKMSVLIAIQSQKNVNHSSWRGTLKTTTII